MLQRDGHVARRNLLPMLMQNLLQPLLLTFVFGRILTASGMMRVDYKNILLPGIMAISMVLSGIQAVAMPLIAELQFTKEIEDRLLAPMENHWLAVEKIVAGMIQALVSGLVVIPAAWLLIGSGVQLNIDNIGLFALICFLVALFSSTGGLTLGCSIGQTQVGLMFSLVVAPMMMFGCAYYSWHSLGDVSKVLQYAVLVNPLVYACEGLRSALVPQVTHRPPMAVVGALIGLDTLLVVAGLRKFRQKTIG